MLKYAGTATYTVNRVDYVFTGRNPKIVDDEIVKKDLLSTGCFSESKQGLTYIGGVEIEDDDGKAHKVDAQGNVNANANKFTKQPPGRFKDPA